MTVEELKAAQDAGAVNREGGMLAWSSRIDPTVPRT